jgi:hypothetical protein
MEVVEPSDEPLPNLHDAVLERVVIDWDRVIARIELTRVPGGPTVLELPGLVDFKMTRQQEWGPSVFVNAAEVHASHGKVVLSIEMQSGDVIAVAAQSVARA